MVSSFGKRYGFAVAVVVCRLVANVLEKFSKKWMLCMEEKRKEGELLKLKLYMHDYNL
jgi:hypothetical protein